MIPSAFAFGTRGILSGLTERDRSVILENLVLRLSVEMDDLACETRSLKEELRSLKSSSSKTRVADASAAVPAMISSAASDVGGGRLEAYRSRFRRRLG